MARTSPGFVRDLYALASLLPWWLSVALAFGSYFMMQWIAGSGPAKHPAPLAEIMSTSVVYALALGMKYLLPAVFVMGAVASLFRRDKSAPTRRAHELAFPAHAVDTTQWDLHLLRALEWKRFERLCADYFREIGLRAEMQASGPDNGIDIRLYAPGQRQPGILAQCKSWKTYPVGVKPVRELLGVMTSERVAEGIVATTSTFTQDAKAFAMGKNIHLIDGEGFMEKLKALDPAVQQRLLARATEGDYTTPTCPSCGKQMVMRKGTFGRPDFWGCRNYPACHTTLAGST